MFILFAFRFYPIPADNVTQHLSVLSVIVGLTAWHGVNKVCYNITATSPPVIFYYTRFSDPPPGKCLLCLEALELSARSSGSWPS